MSETMNDAERAEYLKSLGLPSNGVLGAVPARTVPPVHQPEHTDLPLLVPPGADPHTIPVEQINLDPRLLDRFPSLDGTGATDALRYLHSLYVGAKGQRNKDLHAKCQKFIRQVRDQRLAASAGVAHVKETIKTTATERDNGKVLAAAGIDTDELAKMLLVMQALKEQGVDLDSLITTEA